MTRLVNFPVGLGRVKIEYLSGPGVISSGATSSLAGYEQTRSGIGDLWRFRLHFPPVRGAAYRDLSGWSKAMRGGANWSRMPFFDPDRPSYGELGLAIPPMGGIDWGNGKPWSNGRGWAGSPGSVAVAAAAGADTGVVTLSDALWGHRLTRGSKIGFFPFHFGMYEIDEVLEPGVYSIWPNLRLALTTSHRVTLQPVLSMKLDGWDAVALDREVVAAMACSATLTEVPAYDVYDELAA